jgi:uncharacterized protein (DUF2267 family)
MADQQFTRDLTVLAEDPSIKADGKRPLLTKVKIPAERFLPGPRGARLEVVDYDSTANVFYAVHTLREESEEKPDEFADAADLDSLVGNPCFHAQHVFGVAAATLFEFERALGRSVSWGFQDRSHQLKIVPHAFKEANAFYSKEDEAVLFGYFDDPRREGATVFTCLSHDIVAHEITHAILDGLRDQLTRPSSLDQAAFHEGFSDIVALLSTLRSESLIQHAIGKDKFDRVPLKRTLKRIQEKSILFGVAEEMGAATNALGRGALRNSVVELAKKPKSLNATDEPHDRGEILVAAVLTAFVTVWHTRLYNKYRVQALKKDLEVDAWRVAEEGAKAAQHLLTMLIRAIDYLPPVHVEFRDFLMATLTADWQTSPDDTTYRYRDILLESFAQFGITPHKSADPARKGAYQPFKNRLDYNRGNIESMRSDPEGMFRFIWENRAQFGLAEDAYTRVNSVRSVARVGPDGVIVRETIAEYYQLVKRANYRDLQRYGISLPKFATEGVYFDLVGGGTLIFNEFGVLTYHIANHIKSARQTERLNVMAEMGQLLGAMRQPFALAHLRAGGLGLRYSDRGAA